MTEPLHIISLGAGVQSSAMALMAAAGEIGPMPHCAIFADTQAEPASVYAWLDWLEKQLPFPVHRVTKGNLEEASLRVRTSEGGKNYTKHAIPAFITDGAANGLMMRQCTADFKIEVIVREVARIRKGLGKPRVIQWIGISRDEMRRMKAARVSYIENHWPLVMMGIERRHCLEWMERKGFPKPPRSSCRFCPYHSDDEWRRLRDEEPAEFQAACDYEPKLQLAMAQVSNFRGTPFLHRSLKPLKEVDFDAKPSNGGQGDLFLNECEGMCGV